MNSFHLFLLFFVFIRVVSRVPRALQLVLE